MADLTKNIILNFTTNSEVLDGINEKITTVNDKYAEQIKTFDDVNSATAKNTLLTNINTKATQDNANVTAEQQAVYDKLSKSLATLSGESKKAVQTMLQASPKELAKQFDVMGVSVDDYINLLEKLDGVNQDTGQSSQKLTTQLRSLKDAMGQLELAGQRDTEQFKELQKQYAVTGKALNDINTITKNAASDAPKLELFGAAVRGIGAAFQGAVSATALFGEENKDLQEVLVKVNAAMALTQALNEGVALATNAALVSTVKEIAAAKVLVAQKAIQNGLESESIVIRYAAIVAQKALNLAMAANPILLLVAGLVTFVAAIYAYTQSTKAAAEETARFNAVIEEATVGLEAFNKGLTDALDKQNAELKDAGALQSAILANTGRNLVQQLQANGEEQLKVSRELNRLNQLIFEEGGKENVEAAAKAQTALTKLEEDGDKLRTEIVKTGISTRRAVIEEALQKEINLRQEALSRSNPAGTGQFGAQVALANAQAALDIEQNRGNAEKIKAIQADLQNKIRDISIARQQFVADNEIAIAQSTLIKEQNITKEAGALLNRQELEAQNELDKELLQRSLINIKLTAAEKQALTDQTNQKIADRERDFNKAVRLREIEDDRNQQALILDDINKSETEKLNAKIIAIQDAAEIEIVAAKGNAEKLNAIEFKREQDILAAKKAAIDAAAAHELAVFNATHAAETRFLQTELDKQSSIASNDEGLGGANRAANRLGTSIKSVEEQQAIVRQLTRTQVEAVDIQISALEKKADLQGGLNEKEQEDYANLQDAKTAILEESVKRQADIEEAARKKRRDRTIEEVNLSVGAIQDGLSILGSFYQQQDEADQQRLDAKKQRIQDELDAGNISAKEARRRENELAVEQKKLQYEQAKRNKQLALFQAIINTALAVTNAIVTGDPYTAALRAAIAAAIGGAQIALIASKPLPTFNTGKKSSWSGIGEVAEQKPEIVEKDGRMFLVTEPTVMHLGAKDRVYNPSETIKMMEAMTFGKNVIASPHVHKAAEKIDYNLFGKAVSDNVPQFGFDITEHGITEWIKKGNSLTKYLNKRRNWNIK